MFKVNILVFAFLFSQQLIFAQIRINELCPANADIQYDPQFYNFSPWVELHNPSGSSVDISGYFLTDDVNMRTKWAVPAFSVIPANGYLIIWCDGMNTNLHTSFSLNSSGEELILSSPSGTQVDRIEYPVQFTNISYGRVANGWGYLAKPTPGTTNGLKEATTRLMNPLFSKAAGKYSGTLQVSISNFNPNAEIRYTVDGSDPVENSTLYTDAITINNTQVLKAKAFADGLLPSATETATYFVNERNISLPIISITTKPNYLWNNTIGIYADGSNGITGNCRDTPVNWNQDWDRHAVFEYFDASGNSIVNQDIDIRIGGACSRNQPQKSLVIKARDKYGDNIIRHPFFEDKKLKEFGGFILRNSGNDFNVTMFRDAFLQKLASSQMNIDYMAYQPAVLYLNGEYWGIQNLREKIDGDYIESNYGYKKSEIDLIETWEYAIEGTTDLWLTYKNALQAMDRSTEEAFTFIDQNIEVDEYINYLVTEIYYANTDWPGNNMKFWRSRTPGGKFRWILWDTDFGFGLYSGASYPSHPTLSFATNPEGENWPNPAWSTLHIRMVLENPIFRTRFIQKLNAALNTTFSPVRVNEVINQFANRIGSEVPFHKQKWGGNIGDWDFEVQRLRDFSSERNQFMRTHMAQFFGLGESIQMSVSVANESNGKYKLNGIVSEGSSNNELYFKGLPYTLEAVPKPGYKFKQWNVTAKEITNVPLVGKGAEWSYHDQGTLPAANWNTPSYDASAWLKGAAQLGYGDGDEQTLVSYGADANNKHITTYFRKTFTVADTIGMDQISATALYDDGIVVYLNGTEVYRNNMPQGAITNSTLASVSAIENVYTPFVIAKGIIKPGTNVLAVEVHQNSTASSDVSFDLDASAFLLGDETNQVITNSIVIDTARTSISYEAEFEEDSRFISGVVINEVNSRISSALDNAGDAEDWIELYNAGTSSVNLAGLFITDDLRNSKKHKILPGAGDEMQLAPGEYKVFWADGEIGEGVNHLSFKLSSEGEAVGLYQIVDNVVNVLDEYYLPSQLNAGSYSRIPDGQGEFEFTAAITPGNSNMLVLSAGENEHFTVFPNPVADFLYIQSDQVIQFIEVKDNLGRRIKEIMNVNEPVSFHDIPSGIYLLSVKTKERVRTIRIIKN